MMKFYKSLGGYVEITGAEKGCWINVVAPDPQEISLLKNEFKVPEDIIQDILDIDERPRLEYDDDFTLIILRIPVQFNSNGVPFHTIPLGIFMSHDHVITICSNDNEVLPSAQPSLYRGQYQKVNDSINFILKLFLHSANIYLKYLKQINQQTSLIEQDLEKSIRNKELQKLLKMEKSLVYFTTSLKGNELVLAKFRNSKMANLSEINEDLLEDAIIENKQAAEMAQIYSDIQSGMMDAFASVISNNLNVVMKQLTSISIILMIPTLIASIYGMNVTNFIEHSVYAFPGILVGSAIIAYLGVYIFRKKNWF
ncbi:MAG: magnesium transporter CorA family protein [Bacteroidales bacterium]|nr:magnesium transporter CorA family protein [Bacteroidales bacterium]